MEIGSGGGGTTLQADRFVLAARSEYFRASLNFPRAQEGSEGRVNLNVTAPLPSAAAARGLLRFLYTGSLADAAAATDDGAGGEASLGPADALDVLHVTGQTDDGGGYLQLRDNQQLRNEARRMINEGICKGNAFDLLRRAESMGQEEAKTVIMEWITRPGCCPDPGPVGQGDGESSQAQVGAGWWSEKQENALLRELLMRMSSVMMQMST